jgi:hypothetical protein
MSVNIIARLGNKGRDPFHTKAIDREHGFIDKVCSKLRQVTKIRVKWGHVLVKVLLVKYYSAVVMGSGVKEELVNHCTGEGCG